MSPGASPTSAATCRTFASNTSAAPAHSTEYQQPDGTWAPVSHRTEQIVVRGGRDVSLDVLTTTHASAQPPPSKRPSSRRSFQPSIAHSRSPGRSTTRPVSTTRSSLPIAPSMAHRSSPHSPASAAPRSISSTPTIRATSAITPSAAFPSAAQRSSTRAPSSSSSFRTPSRSPTKTKTTSEPHDCDAKRRRCGTGNADRGKASPTPTQPTTRRCKAAVPADHQLHHRLADLLRSGRRTRPIASVVRHTSHTTDCPPSRTLDRYRRYRQRAHRDRRLSIRAHE